MFSYYKYYLEIKNRVLLLISTWLSLIIVCYHFKEPLLFVFINSNQYCNNLPYFIFTNVGEIFQVYLCLTFFVANQITILMVFYHSLMFLTLSLYYSEYIQLKLISKIFIFTWSCSVVLLTKLVVPFTWSFFLSFQETNSYLQPTSFFLKPKLLNTSLILLIFTIFV